MARVERCNLACPHGDRCTLDLNHHENQGVGCNHQQCSCNEPNRPVPSRPSWDVWFMELAHVTAKRASCLRKQVGAVLVRDRDKQIISSGYNGAPRGMPDCLDVGCELREIGGKLSCVRTIHAESNALDRIVVPLIEPHTMYCTVIPCRDCALRIIQNGMIHRVVYAEYYESRNTKDVEALLARQDAATVASFERIYGPLAGYTLTPRVKLEQLKL